MFVAVSSRVPKCPPATPTSTLSVLAANQAYSRSWMVPAPVGRQVGEPPASRQPLQDVGGAVADEVRTVDEHDARPAAAGVVDPNGTLADGAGLPIAARRGRAVGVEEDVSDAGEASAFGERKHPQAVEVERSRCHSHLPPKQGATVPHP